MSTEDRDMLILTLAITLVIVWWKGIVAAVVYFILCMMADYLIDRFYSEEDRW